MVICLERGANDCIHSSWCHCNPVISCFIKIQMGLTFLVLAYPGCPGRETVKQVSVCRQLWLSLAEWLVKDAQATVCTTSQATAQSTCLQCRDITVNCGAAHHVVDS